MKFKVGDKIRFNCLKEEFYNGLEVVINEIKDNRYYITYLNREVKGQNDSWSISTIHRLFNDEYIKRNSINHLPEWL